MAAGNGPGRAIRWARGWAALYALVLISVGRNWEQGLPGGKQTWGPAGWAAIERLLAYG